MVIITNTDITLPGIKVDHNAEWIQDEKEPHVTYFLNHARLEILGTCYESTSIDAKITMLGPCGVTWFSFETEMGRIILFHTHLPKDHLLQEVEFTWFAESSVPRLLAWYVVGNWISQWRNDIEIWSNKVLMHKPLLVRGDGPIMPMRRWYRQFYSSTANKKKSGEGGGDNTAKEQPKAPPAEATEGGKLDW
jgi:cholesterol 7-desaturase